MAKAQTDAKARLDRLMGKARALYYKPIQIAEILHQDRIGGEVALANLGTYRRASTRWRNKVVLRIYGRVPQLNARYEDQLFDRPVMPPEVVELLGATNREHNGMVEAYIYLNAFRTTELLASVRDVIESAKSSGFDILSFLRAFEDQRRLKRSVDKAYEISVYALFDAVTRQLKATVTLSVGAAPVEILRDFSDFAELLLGVTAQCPEITLAANLYRVGATNVNDAGLDMWANFGPAVQVKHITITPEYAGELITETGADQVVIVCVSAEKDAIVTVLEQVGLGSRLRGIITEEDLVRWYALAFSDRHSGTIGEDLISAMRKEFDNEFPIVKQKEFMEERGYSRELLIDGWEINP